MAQMNNKVYPTAIAFSLYIHGFTLYFTLTGLVGIQATILTAAYQVFSLLLVVSALLTDSKMRRQFFKIRFIDILYFSFIILFIVEFFISPNKSKFPEALIIYFTVYWSALVLARSLTFRQFKLICYATTCITLATCFINYGQVLTNRANWVNNGSRLAAGMSGNPINLGYTGAFSCLACIVFSIRAKSAVSRLLYLILSIVGFMVCGFTGTRSATLTCLGGFILISVYLLNIVSKTNKSFSKFTVNSVSIFSIILCGILIFSATTTGNLASGGSQLSVEESSPLALAIERGVDRISTIGQLDNDEERDASAQGRTELYALTWKTFQDNPILGTGLYSSKAAHNAFLQTASEFGLFGVLTFTASFVYLSIQMFATILKSLRIICSSTCNSPEKFIRSDYFLVACFAIIFWTQAVCLFSFHGDPYRNYLPIGSIGVLIAFLELNSQKINLDH
jgi:O-Antigen ligase